MIKGYELRLEDELPIISLPDISEWSENYAFIGYDFQSKVGFCAYIGRWVKNPNIFREQLYLYLPDGSILSHISMGKPGSKDVITAGCLELRCEKPGGRWRISFDGPMRHDSLTQLKSEPVLQGQPHAVSFDVIIDHNSPTWMFPRADNTTFGNFHYEQVGQCQGSVKFNEKKFSFAAATYRDHTRGPRNFFHFDSHIWLQLHFPGGPSFSTYQVWHNQGGKCQQSLNLGTSVRPDELREASLLNSPKLESLDNFMDPVTAVVSLEGREIELVGKPVAALAYSFSRDVEFYYGLIPSQVAFYCMEQPLIFESEEGPVYGYIQRSGQFR
jgi:hypothetical protein